MTIASSDGTRDFLFACASAAKTPGASPSVRMWLALSRRRSRAVAAPIARARRRKRAPRRARRPGASSRRRTRGAARGAGEAPPRVDERGSETALGMDDPSSMRSATGKSSASGPSLRVRRASGGEQRFVLGAPGGCSPRSRCGELGLACVLHVAAEHQALQLHALQLARELRDAERVVGAMASLVEVDTGANALNQDALLEGALVAEPLQLDRLTVLSMSSCTRARIGQRADRAGHRLDAGGRLLERGHQIGDAAPVRCDELGQVPGRAPDRSSTRRGNPSTTSGIAIAPPPARRGAPRPATASRSWPREDHRRASSALATRRLRLFAASCSNSAIRGIQAGTIALQRGAADSSDSSASASIWCTDARRHRAMPNAAALRSGSGISSLGRRRRGSPRRASVSSGSSRAEPVRQQRRHVVEVVEAHAVAREAVTEGRRGFLEERVGQGVLDAVTAI